VTEFRILISLSQEMTDRNTINKKEINFLNT
jgi:hypothetical protein